MDLVLTAAGAGGSVTRSFVVLFDCGLLIRRSQEHVGSNPAWGAETGTARACRRGVVGEYEGEGDPYVAAR
ncbi:hypothetical protein, partial [Agromyces humi]|uniref:hypothetical protein n=1 Tax=Agromyces humi TaxID=1766800 RepID=UPI00193AC1AB